MHCPFLREGRAQYCSAAPVRKLILDGPCSSGGGRCTSPAHRECALAREESGDGMRCPHLEDIRVQYCGASPVAPLVPFSESSRSKCSNGGHRYCDTYLALARPHRTAAPPKNLLFAPNHLWLDASEEGLCHIGVDAFLVDVVGGIDGVTFVTVGGSKRPVVALQVNGFEWLLSFPNLLRIQTPNTYAQSNPQRVAADPYGAGWLFQGWEVPQRTRAGLIGGEQAVAWLDEEKQRLARYIHESQELGADGGEAAPGVLRLVPRAGVVALFQRFFGRTDWAMED
jgi:glycine cleavage system H lipoate-binding protein